MASTGVLKGRVSFWQGLRYRGKQGMLTWALHRITGLCILVFVGIHVVAAFFLQQFGDDISIAVTTIYESWQFQIVVYFCVLYHALHGLRLTLEDLFPSLLRFHKELIWFQWILFIPLYGLPVFMMIQNALAGGT
jgi:succinate dehydrogenase / fumarate reductase cytochrome b subunit